MDATKLKRAEDALWSVIDAEGDMGSYVGPRDGHKNFDGVNDYTTYDGYISLRKLAVAVLKALDE
jgi:hypothetical protein